MILHQTLNRFPLLMLNLLVCLIFIITGINIICIIQVKSIDMIAGPSAASKRIKMTFVFIYIFYIPFFFSKKGQSDLSFPRSKLQSKYHG